MPTRGVPRRPKYSEPTEEQRKRAEEFGEWQLQARKLKGWNMPILATETGYSYSHVRIYDPEARGGFDDTGRYRQPKEDYIRSIADRTGADFRRGMIAAGLWKVEMGPLTEVRILATGDEIRISPTDPNPDETARLAEIFLRTLRESRTKQ